ncbi:MAG: hypothetical protein M1400_02450, partial [Patescibacteria group bacterium]|nr:hypothetical protein [Patescibacteria group bacterium]
MPTASDDVVIGVASTIKVNAPTSVSSLSLGTVAGNVASVLVFNYDAISAGPVLIANDLTIYTAAQITHTAGTAAVLGRINLSVGGNANINGSISADGKGFYVGQGFGAGPTTTGTAGTGGSYGGLGAVGDGPAPTSALIYGSLMAPTDLGSGGGRTCNRGAASSDTGLWGGGAIKLSVVGSINLNGVISANGSSSEPIDQCWNPGSGSGGSVYLTTGTLTGNGTISTNGGSANSYMGGSGGRVAIYYAADASSVKVQSFGGAAKINGITRYAGAGTIYKKSAAQGNGDLIIDNNNLGGSSETVLGLTPITTNTPFVNFSIKNSASIFLTVPSLTVTNASITGNAFYDVLPSTTLNYTSLNWTGGMLQDSNGTLAVLAQNQDLTVPAGSKLIFNVPNATRTYNNLTVNGTLTHAYNDSAVTATPAAGLTKLNWAINGNLVINAGGSINADGKGYRIGQGPGAGLTTTNTKGTGGSYGGLGAVGDGPAPTSALIYGSLTAPTDLGSGGGRTCNRGAASSDTGLWGGGAIQFTVSGTTTINGSLSANGSSSEPIDQCWDPGSGAGGSVYLTTGALTGSGMIAANGSGAGSYMGGSGGRVAVYYMTDTSSLNYQSFGGGVRYSSITRYAGAGTIYKKSAAQGNGDLIIDNNNLGGSSETVLGLTPLASTSTLGTLGVKNSAGVFLGNSTLSASNVSISGNGLYDARAGTALAYAVLNWTGGMLQDSNGTLAVLAQNQDLTVPAGSKLIFNVPNATRTYNNLTVNGTLTHWNNDVAITGSPSLNKINWAINGNLVINAGGSINADGKGYRIGQGPGAGPTTTGTEGSGGSYGGLGGYSDAAAAPTSALIYGSLTAPTDLGSGGGRTCNRGA